MNEAIMRFLGLVFLGVVNGVFGSGDLCGGAAYEACQTANWSFPKSEAELDQMCQPIAHDLACEKDYSDRCEFYDDLAEERFQKLRTLVADACQKDSPLHLDIVQNIGCLNEVIENDSDTCHRHMRSKASVMAKYIQSVEVEEGYEGYTRQGEYWKTLSCLIDSLRMACFISKTSNRCGSDVQDIAIEVLTRADITYRTCSTSGEEILEELLSLLKLGLEEDALLNKFLTKE